MNAHVSAYADRLKTSDPVFFDATQKRWHGFLIFTGSALATLGFLFATLWISLNSDADFSPLQAAFADDPAELSVEQTIDTINRAATDPRAAEELNIAPTGERSLALQPPSDFAAAEPAAPEPALPAFPIELVTPSAPPAVEPAAPEAVATLTDAEQEAVLAASPSIEVLGARGGTGSILTLQSGVSEDSFFTGASAD